MAWSGISAFLTRTATRTVGSPRISATGCSRSVTASRPMARCGRSAWPQRRWPVRSRRIWRPGRTQRTLFSVRRRYKGTGMALLREKHFFYHGTDEYEVARRETVWNSILPDRFPAAIMQARDAKDVVAAVHHARAQGYQVGVRSGGHSWNASHLRDGGMLLDVSRLDQCVVDTDRMVAYVGPGKIAS